MSHNVRVLVFDEADLVLAVSELPPDDPSIFKLPGGSVESGESPEQAALRELNEELGVTSAVLTLVGVHPTSGGDNTYVYEASFDLTCIAFGPDIADHVWVSPSRVPEDWPKRRYIMSALALRGTK